MGWLQFFAALVESFVALVGAVAWPAVAAGFLWLFRSQIVKLFENLAAFDFMGLKLNLRERAEEAKAAASEMPEPAVTDGKPIEKIDPYGWLQGLYTNLAATNPAQAIAFAWEQVGTELQKTCDRFEVRISESNRFPPIIIAHELFTRGILPESAYKLADILNATASEAYIRPWRPNPRLAGPVMEFAESAAKLIGVLRSLEPKPQPAA